jgi:hypothetical protein
MTGDHMAEKELTLKEKSKQEGQKLLYDSVKHLTTLSTGSILLLIALLEKVFTSARGREWEFLIAVCFVCFTASMVASVITMIVLSNSVFYFREDVELGSKKGALIFYLSLSMFVLGVVSIVVFALKNFLPI